MIKKIPIIDVNTGKVMKTFKDRKVKEKKLCIDLTQDTSLILLKEDGKWVIQTASFDQSKKAEEMLDDIVDCLIDRFTLLERRNYGLSMGGPAYSKIIRISGGADVRYEVWRESSSLKAESVHKNRIMKTWEVIKECIKGAEWKWEVIKECIKRWK